MSKIALSSNALGTGTLTIASPNTNTDRTLTLPDNTGTLFSNADIATAPVALAGTSTTTLMTPALVKYQRDNDPRTRSSGFGTGLTLTTSDQNFMVTSAFVATTPLVLLLANFQLNVVGGTTAFDTFARLQLVLAGPTVLDFYDQPYSVSTAQFGLGAVQAGSPSMTVYPVVVGSTYYGQVLGRKSGGTSTAQFLNGRIDVACL